MDTRPLMTPAAVAERLGLHERTVRRLANAGTIPCVRLTPRKLRFEPDAIDAFIASKAIEAAS